MQYDLIQGQGHEPMKVGNPSISKAISSAIYKMGADKWPLILKKILLQVSQWGNPQWA